MKLFFLLLFMFNLSSCAHRYTEAEKHAMTYRSPVTGSIYDQTVFGSLPMYLKAEIEGSCDSFKITDPCVQGLIDNYLATGLEKRMAGVETEELNDAKSKVEGYRGAPKAGINPDLSACQKGQKSSDCSNSPRDLKGCVGISRYAYTLFASPQSIPATVTMYNGCPEQVKISRSRHSNMLNESLILKPGESRRVKYEATNPLENDRESVSIVSLD